LRSGRIKKREEVTCDLCDRDLDPYD
jgi:hypothetical protein